MNASMKRLEKAERKNKRFPFYIYRNAGQRDHTVFLPHWHTEFEIIYADCCGQAELDNVQTQFQPKDVLFINKEVLHHADAYTCGVMTSLVFDFSLLNFRTNDVCQIDVMEQLKAKKLIFPPIVRVGTHCHQALITDICNIIACFYSETPGKELKIKSLLYDIIFICLSEGLLAAPPAASQQQTQHAQLAYIKSALSFMEANYNRQIDLSDMANHVNLSKFHFIKLFKAYTDTTPGQYLKEVRLEHAKSALLSGHSVTDAALLCGFNNISYFICSFKERYRMTPKEFQRHPQV